MHLKIVASPLPSEADGTRFRWTVNISSDDRVLKHNLSLSDPLKETEKEDCKWYLEKYLGIEPYSITKARSAAALFDKYGQALLHQLQLSDIVPDNEQNLTIEVEDVSVSNSGQNSVHQLAWEFLEDERLWKGQLSVRVRRLCGTPAQPRLAHERMSSWRRSGRWRQQINILLVTARDLGTNSREHTDISPALVSDLLAGVRSRLRSSKAAIDLNLEVVRPGTWEALKQHLEKSRRVHGHGYFHIIHFDVHGRVKRPSNIGVLYFCDPRVGSTGKRSVAASMVAEKVGKQGIPIVILNACESARANAGEDANIAHSFSKAGINNVLAMTYQISESATKLFMGSFYMQFLAEGRSFTDSATVARCTLRLQPSREARFQQQSPLCDWFIPVVYTSSAGLVLERPDVVQESNFEEKYFSPQIIEEHAPKGREFDLLRLEKCLVPNEILYLSGPPGIGKTTFLRYTASSWKSTSFVDHVVFLDSASGIWSIRDFFKNAVKQLRTSIAGTDVGEHSSDANEWNIEGLLEILTDVRVAFILDGLMDVRIPEGRNGPPAKLCISLIVEFLKIAMSRPGELRQESHVVIVSGRSKELGGPFGLEKSHYELNGLRLMEAVDILHQIIAGQPDGKSNQLAELRKMEPLAHLLQGNPAALVQISAICRDSGISPRRMYDILHGENLVRNLDPSLLTEHLELLQEFREFWVSLSNGGAAALLMLSWYWHEGPCICDFAEMLVTMGIVSKSSTVHTALGKASRLGYVELDSAENRISWINPLFTIFCRVISCSSFSGFTFTTGNNRRDFQAAFAAKEMGLLVANAEDYLPWPPWKVRGLEYAVRLVCTVLSSHLLRDIHLSYLDYLAHFTIAYRNSCKRHSSLILSTWPNAPLLQEQLDSCKQNFIFMLKICHGRGPFPLPQDMWPTSAIINQGHIIRKACNTEERAIIAHYYEGLLNGAVKYSKFMYGKNAVRSNDLGDILHIAGALADMYREDIPQLEKRHLQIISFGTQLVEESEKVFGPPAKDNITASSAPFSISKALVLLGEGKFEESRAEIQRTIDMSKVLFDMSRPGAQTRYNTFMEGKSPKDKDLWEKFFKSTSSNIDELKKAWDMMILSAKGEPIEQQGSSDAANLTGNILSMITQVLPQIVSVMESPETKLQLIEQEMNRGHWLRASSHHNGLIVKAMENLDFDEVMEHVQAQENLATQYKADGQSPGRIADAKEFSGIMQTFLSQVTAKDGLEVQQLVKTQESFMSMMKKKGIAHPALEEMDKIMQESAVRDHDPDLAHNWAPSVLSRGGTDMHESLQHILRKHLLKSARSTEYRDTTLLSISKIHATLRDLEHAEDESDTIEIFRHLGRLDVLAADEVYGERLSKDKIQERREWNTERLFLDLWKQVEALMEDHKFDEARGAAAKCDTVMSLGQASAEVQVFAADVKFADVVLVRQFDHHVSLAKQAMEEPDFKKARDHLQDAVGLNANDAILNAKSHCGSIELLSFFRSTQAELARASLHVAVKQRQWSDGIVLCQKWRAQPEIWKAAIDSDKAEVVLDMEQLCIGYNDMREFYKTLLSANVFGAAEKLQVMKKLQKRKAQKKMGLMEDLSAQSRLLKSIIDTGEIVMLSMTRAMFTGGPEAAYKFAFQIQDMLRQSGWHEELGL